MKRNIRIALGCLALVGLLAGCRGTRQAGRASQAGSLIRQVQLIRQNEPSFATMNASHIGVDARVGDRDVHVTAALKIQTDSVVALSVMPFMGIEMFALELYPDRWALYDKVNRRYCTDDYAYFDRRWGVQVDFATLQSLLSARMPAVEASRFHPGDWQFTPLEGGGARLEDMGGRLTRILTTHPTHTVAGVEIADPDGRFGLTAVYDDYAVTRGVNFPRRIALTPHVGGSSPLALTLRVQKVTFDGDLRFRPANPARYKRATVEELMIMK